MPSLFTEHLTLYSAAQQKMPLAHLLLRIRQAFHDKFD